MSAASKTDRADLAHMRTALTLAGRGLGLVHPNPAVGCVIVDAEGTVAGRGWTQPGGRPHAESEALARAGERAKGATAYVTLEPCDHKGRTPPCSKALIEAGIKRVVVACADTDPRVAGKGIERLQAAGIEVTQGVLENDAVNLNAGFFSRIERGRPLFTLKAATTLDGRIATRSGDSKWITGPQARAYGHLLRARHDAIMVGIGTALADDPALTCRLPGMEGASPHRIVADTRLMLPVSSQLVQTAGDVPTVLITSPQVERSKINEMKTRGVLVIDVPTSPSGHADLKALAKVLGEQGFTRVLIEGGGKLAGSFLQAGLVDRLAWFRSGKIIGGDGISSVAAYGVESLSDSACFHPTGLVRCGEDVLETFENRQN